MSDQREAIGFKEEIRGLHDLAGKAGIILREDAVVRLEKLGAHIREWNRKVNLISRNDVHRLISYHFCDSASVLPIVRPQGTTRILDIGGSNGLPGLVLAALSPHFDLTICDSKRKRAGFLEAARKDVGESVSIEIDRVDNAIFQEKYMTTFDLIVARAVTRLKLLLRWCLPILAPGGLLVAYKGSRCIEEARQAEQHLWANGGRLLIVVGSPWATRCNPLRKFAIAGKSK
jgi:16S rRNA (guanine527-N7)-methyltransferase